MAGRAAYSDQDKARVYVALTANNGNVKRTVRDTGIPESTVRNWKREFEKNPPPQDQVEAELSGGDYISDLEQTRNEALATLRRKIPAMNGSQLGVVFGILEDKLTRARGLATERTEHVHKLPSAEELALAGQMLAQGALQAAKQRQQEIVEAEVREQPALPRATGP
ncbi:MAG: transposase [Patescibacteria group bacterium]|nr:transposase [Patescibacteria group bacterium]